MTPLPKRLSHQPLAESLVEVRIGSAEQPLPVVLPGLVFSNMSGTFSGTEALPLASLPKEIRQQDPNLKFKAFQRLVGEHYVLSVGDNVLALSRLAPYCGWSEFRDTIQQLFSIIESSGLVQDIVRYSMKSLNIIPQLAKRQLDMVQLDAAWRGVPISDQGFRMRCEMNDDRWNRIVEVTPNVTSVSRAGEKYSGLSVNIDCIRELGAEHGNWKVVLEGLEELHDECKSLFFSLLTAETLDALGPEYDD